MCTQLEPIRFLPQWENTRITHAIESVGDSL